MKKSKFNIFLKDSNEEKFVLFNSKTTALVLMNKEEFELYRELELKKFVTNNDDDKKFLLELKKGEFIIDSDVDEIEVFKYLQNIYKFSKESISLTIAPTLGCNFGCNYCYQGEHNSFSKMSLEVQNQIIDFVKSNISKISAFDVTWYGGEPLLAIDVIRRLTSEFKKICSENNVMYNASIITNGYYLNKDIASEFSELSIRMAQVTLDGNKDYHDSKRALKNGDGTFEKIISNLIEIKDVFPNVSIRVNTDKLNSNNVFEIIDILKENNLIDKYIPYLGYVESTNDFYDDDKCLSIKDFSEVNSKFTSKISRTININPSYPQVRFNSCIADSVSGYVIDPDGKLYKCWCDIGFDEYSVGNIKDGINKYNRIIEYFNYDVCEDETCKSCNIIPLCLGGCPRKRVDSGNNGHCYEIKYSLLEKLSCFINDKIDSDKYLDFKFVNNI
ncbi:radical SAM protein [Clostridium perfringens]|uniref:radical SAM/SPASM domain-containing protein n=1 Tax=Clostridium perfringens TaxID=1502 RepID=UPI00240EDAFF|nr:radical SAM protein [Clostridium perfringens]MDK0737874.1 radical SAM protein [Clostridium perfringens]MDM0744586.1 radical SAM protein [Clostridium perfringens]MDM0756177.1 radical SAM protein [Clostridium perfringens]MDM0759095.1 radical SAM protein [Clostridium perfringens]MDM0793930.1 radical SAM protein [Clostridium perfringens]